MKKVILTLAISFSALISQAQSEVMKIELNNGQTQTVLVSDIKEITFEVDGNNPASPYLGAFTGTNTVVVGGMFTYSAENVTFDIEQAGDGTLTVNIPQYCLTGTVMGDLTLGAYSIEGLAFDDEKQAYCRNYGDDGLSMHFTAVQNGTVSMDKDYNFNPGSEITVEKTDAGIKITNKFKIGAMPFDLTATFEGVK
ncbi:MAG: calycin-like domain-containing protein [Bacteroidales bacterium]|nr:calycin-like domain-containing protein [Bacteroidales bacterium]